jgi:hypothetical protein
VDLFETSSLEVASQEYCVLVALSQVFVFERLMALIFQA